ncbi:MAG: hypothetical protein HFG27_08360 [Provencibacterium sp.]|jgi:hypothetical protein|nr:hypothetical protein [Provencibacterium sp.]
MTKVMQKINTLFEELVPASGQADTVAGEIVRAMTRIAYRNSNDGDHVGVGYGKETCNPAARYLTEKCDEEIASLLAAIWGIENDRAYDLILEQLEVAVLEYLKQHPELKTTPNSEDMWDYRDEREDVDDSCDEDEGW